MNDKPELETLLESAFRGGALPAAPASLVAALEAVPAGPVTRDADARRLARRGRPWSGALGVAAVLLVGGALALSIGGPVPNPDRTALPSLSRDPAPSPAPSATAVAVPSTDVASSFISPFEYTIPAGTTVSIAVQEREIIGWVEGPLTPPSSDVPLRYSDRQSGAGDAQGIVIASAEQAWSHGSTGRFAVRQAPADLLADLRDTAAIGIGDISEVTLDGRPALMAEIDPTVKPGTDLHITGDMCCISRDYIMLTAPSQITVLEVGDVTIFIQIWARTAEDLAAWMPAATEFLNSIRFTEAP
jgi:hypothetical protein